MYGDGGVICDTAILPDLSFCPFALLSGVSPLVKFLLVVDFVSLASLLTRSELSVRGW